MNHLISIPESESSVTSYKSSSTATSGQTSWSTSSIPTSDGLICTAKEGEAKEGVEPQMFPQTRSSARRGTLPPLITRRASGAAAGLAKSLAIPSPRTTEPKSDVKSSPSEGKAFLLGLIGGIDESEKFHRQSVTASPRNEDQREALKLWLRS